MFIRLEIILKKRTNVYFILHYLICWNNLFPYLHFVIDPRHKLLSVSAFFSTHWYLFFLKHLTKPDMHQNLRCITLNCDSYKFKACDKHDTICQFIFIQFIVWLHISPHHQNRNTHSKISKIYRPSPIIWSNIHLVFF